MEFTYENRKEIEKQYIHASEFTGFEYDYDKREIRLFCDYYFLDNYHPNERNRLFSEMLYFARCKAANFGAWEILFLNMGRRKYRTDTRVNEKI